MHCTQPNVVLHCSPTRQLTEPLPPPTPLPLGAVLGRIGRSQAPQLAAREGITGAAERPLRLVTPWTVPGDGAARAIVYGLDRDKPAIELIDIDRGRVAWRDTTTCA